MQKIDFGIGSSLNIEQYLKKYYVKNVFLVHGKKSFYESGISDVISDLLNKYSFTSFSDFTSNPKIEEYKSFCSEIGFTPGTEKFGECVVEAMKKG